MSVRVLGVLLVLPALMVAACGGDVDSVSAEMQAILDEEVDQELIVRVWPNAMQYLDERIEAPAGARVRVVMDNTETTSPAMVHNVVVLRSAEAADRVGRAAAAAPNHIPDDPAILAFTPLAQPRTLTAVLFTMPPPGEYPFICTYPGHFQAMRGVLVSTTR